MAENDKPGNGAAAPEQKQPAPPLQILGQYVKDLSFEAPDTPQIFEKMRDSSPQIGLNLDVSARRLPSEAYEVGVKVNVNAKIGEETAFILELEYYGLFQINVPQEHLEPVLLIECPRLVFPYVRNLVGDITRDGGFMPLMLQPVDFAALYRDRLAKAQAEKAKAAGQDPAQA
ncbi:MAG: protein-export chaperone SecB [Magnetospiraceae bacterium]